MRRLGWMTLAVVGLTIIGSGPGCGNGGGGGGDLQSACQAQAAAYCSKLNSCSPHTFTLDYADMAGCTARNAQLCQPLGTLNGTSQTASAITACAGAYGGLSCPDFLSGYNFLPAACRGPGTLASGTACGDSHQCTSGYCRTTTSTAANPNSNNCGQCADKVQAGTACKVQEDCAFGLTCDGLGSSRKCVAPADSAAACAAATPCKGGLFCMGGKCAQGQAEGGMCMPIGSTCDSTRGLYCDGATDKCTAYMTAQVGGACGEVNKARVECTGGAGCFGMAPSSTCQAAAADGAACNHYPMGPGCLPGAACVGATGSLKCQVPDPTACK